MSEILEAPLDHLAIDDSTRPVVSRDDRFLPHGHGKPERSWGYAVRNLEKELEVHLEPQIDFGGPGHAVLRTPGRVSEQESGAGRVGRPEHRDLGLDFSRQGTKRDLNAGSHRRREKRVFRTRLDEEDRPVATLRFFSATAEFYRGGHRKPNVSRRSRFDMSFSGTLGPLFG